MKKSVLAIGAVALILAVAFVVQRSEVMLNVDVIWLTSTGLSLSLWNYRVRENVRGASAFLGNFKELPGQVDPQRRRAALLRRQEDGIMEGLIIAAIGSLLGAAGQIFLLLSSI